ncbi:glycosyltransferase family 9 protein [Allokutzneria sp. A3M-2-11 16]|uniref:glycosyltransferase family 9 protein n=1 Tax=Allokutzneria sp. A3M-2-11 16 TaxID=2962043 RepID=UPI0020B7989F|nr:glycosyltransferase family 9 protein [Allokutzneria sp. A3M-2-11 16]MCP3804895.1 glycosyltransferase family 9 protein [Allokutzneria sp. A3M-2-11 16]
MIIALRALKLGDFLVAVPALRALKRHWPDQDLCYAGPVWLTPLAELTGCIDQLLPTPGLEPLSTKVFRPLAAVNLHGAGPESNRVLDALEPRLRLGHSGHGWDGPPWRDDLHERERWCEMLVAHGIPADSNDFRLNPPVIPSRYPGAVVIHPGAAYGSKRWPPERFAQVAAELARQGREVVITGGPGEEELVQEVLGSAGHGVCAAGRTGLPELCALIAEASLVISGDTGTAHLSYAFATPSVVLFGPAPVWQWGPPPWSPHVVLTVAELRRGAAFDEEPDPALLAVGVEDVLAACLELGSQGIPSRGR